MKLDDFKKVGVEIKDVYSKYNKYAWIFCFIFILLFAGFISTKTYDMDSLGVSAENSVFNSVVNQQYDIIKESYPLLSEAQVQTTLTKRVEEIKNTQEYEDQVEGVNSFFQSKYRDEYNVPYLHGIDPYLHLHISENLINNGHFGDKLNPLSHEPVISLRHGREERYAGFEMIPLLTSIVYVVGKTIISNFQVAHALFILPTIFMLLTVIITFFFVKKMFGLKSAILSCLFMSSSAFLVGRVIAGFSDSDFFSLFYPTLIVLSFAYMFITDNKKHKILFSIISIMGTGLYAISWGGWWYVYDIVLAGSFLYLVYSFIKKQLKISDIIFSAIYGIGSILFATIISCMVYPQNFVYYLKYYLTAPLSTALWFVQFKDVGTFSIWPNVLTTVAELGTTNFAAGFNALGGWKTIIIMIVGIFFIYKKEKGKYTPIICLFIPWIVSTFYAASTSLRFSALLVPSVAIFLGISFGTIISFLEEKGSKGLNISKVLLGTIGILVAVVIMVPQINAGYDTAASRMPHMSDGWYDSLKFIEGNSTDAMITSWWDFGHWFVAIANRHVTFDGGDQERRIHFVGKVLSTDNESEAVNVLRMLNCGQEKAYTELLNISAGELNSYDRLMSLVNNERSPDKYEQEINRLYIDCGDIIPQYFIVSEDMIGKAGVWSHFGTWDFERAQVWQEAQHLNRLDFENKNPDYNYQNVKTSDGDQWISGWYGYQQALQCTFETDTYHCEDYYYNVLTKENNFNPSKTVYEHEGKWIVDENSKGEDYTLMLKHGTSYIVDSHIGNSMFTRLMFFDGVGLNNFEKVYNTRTVSGDNIIIYKVRLGEEQ